MANSQNTPPTSAAPSAPLPATLAALPEFSASLQQIDDVLGDKHRGQLIEIVSDLAGAEKAPALLKPDGTVSGLTDILKTFVQVKEDLTGQPMRRKGTAKMLDLQSLIDHAIRFKSDNSVLFAVNGMGNASLTAVLDYHEKTAAGKPGAGQHRAFYQFPFSEEWKAWMKMNFNGSPDTIFDQTKFAEFLEDRAMDLIDPPDFFHADFDAGEADPVKKAQAEALKHLQDISVRLNMSYAKTMELMKLAEGLSATEQGEFSDKSKLSSGEANLSFSKVYKDGRGEDLKVPGLFLIAIPVFYNGPAWRMVVRLRFRVVSGKLIWFYQILKPEVTFKTAFDADLLKAAKETGLPLYLGTPEAS